MQNQAKLLYRLQTIDLQIAQKRARLKAIDEQLSSDQTVAQAAQQREAAEKVLKPVQIRARDLDLEIKSVAEKIQSTDADLYSGRISNPKALREMQEEIESLKRRQSQLEDDLLEAMVDIETKQDTLTDAESALDRARKSLAATQSDLISEREQLTVQLSEAQTKRGAAAEAVEPDSLATYEKMRARMRGTPIALLQGETCSACAVSQTSMVVQQVRSGRGLVICGTCGRILADNS